MHVYDLRQASGGSKSKNVSKTISDSLERIGMRLNSISNTENFGSSTELKRAVQKLSAKCIKLSSNILYGMPIVKDCDEIISLANGSVYSRGSNEIRSLCQDAIREANDLKKQIQSATHSAENQNGSELEHYGRLGMKWGMHIFGKDKTYAKAMNKLRKYDKKSTKNLDKSNKFISRAEHLNLYYRFSEDSNFRDMAQDRIKLDVKIGQRSLNRSVKYRNKAKKLVEAMNKTFANETISSFKPEDIAIGETYCVDVLQRARNESLKTSN